MGSSEANAAEGARRPRRRPDPRRSNKAALAIAQDIVDDITRDDLGPGSKLPGEREMLERFGAGRGTLRESLRFLEMTGAITLKPGPRGGPVVAEQDGQDLAWVLGLFMQLRGVPFGAVVAARETLEPELAGLAAERATAEDHARIKDTIDGMSAFLDDEQNFLAENDRFHAAVAVASGNDLFALVISSLHTITDGVPLGLDYARPRRENVVKSHAEILEAIVAGDAEGARWAMRKHLRRFRTRVEADFPAVMDRPLRWRDIVP